MRIAANSPRACFVPATEPAHAGIDLEMNVGFAAEASCNAIELPCFAVGRKRQRQFFPNGFLHFLRQRRAKQQDGQGDSCLAQGRTFGDIRHTEPVGAIFASSSRAIGTRPCP